MAHVPLIGRLSWREYLALIFGFLFIAAEVVLRVIILFLPKSIIVWFYNKSRLLFHSSHPSSGTSSRASSRDPIDADDRNIANRILKARDFGELCAVYGYEHEEHVVLTKDGYLLGIHRLPSSRNLHQISPGTSTGKPVVYLHHGLLMNSEVWVCLTSAERCLPFVLVEAGYDVWLGNNRGNKYSKKNMHFHSASVKFWDFSMDDFAWGDVPETIGYILETTKAPKVSYIGFSQGTAQAFAALSIHPQLNEKVNVFIALAPAMSPAGLAAPLVDGLMKASPTLIYLFFGRRSILSSTTIWQSILYPPIFARIIDMSLSFLFDWKSANITSRQKVAAYAHLYSFASVKAVVHWFQIMRTGCFQMYDDDLSAISPAVRTSSSSYRPARFPTKNITTPIVLLYGDSDCLVDIESMTSQLPSHTVSKKLKGYEHIDILWGRDVDKDVIPEVLEALKEVEKGGRLINGSGGSINGSGTSVDDGSVSGRD